MATRWDPARQCEEVVDGERCEFKTDWPPAMSAHMTTKHAKQYETARPRSAAASTQASESTRITARIAEYLEFCRRRTENAATAARVSGSPEKLRERVADIDAQLEAGGITIIKEIDLRALRSTLSDQLELIGADGDKYETAEKFFVVNGKDWAESRVHPIRYGNFRDMGVPAAILEEAGIAR